MRFQNSRCFVFLVVISCLSFLLSACGADISVASASSSLASTAQPTSATRTQSTVAMPATRTDCPAALATTF